VPSTRMRALKDLYFIVRNAAKRREWEGKRKTSWSSCDRVRWARHAIYYESLLDTNMRGRIGKYSVRGQVDSDFARPLLPPSYLFLVASEHEPRQIAGRGSSAHLQPLNLLQTFAFLLDDSVRVRPNIWFEGSASLPREPVALHPFMLPFDSGAPCYRFCGRLALDNIIAYALPFDSCVPCDRLRQGLALDESRSY
jgi:hypothetical protein